MSANKQNWLVGVGLALILIAVYLFFYNGVRIINDGVYLYDSTESLVRRGDLSLNFTYDLVAPSFITDVSERPGPHEPLQPLLAAPLFWLGQKIDGIGMMQTTWLFNIIVITVTAILLYGFGLSRGFGRGVSVVVALSFGLTTFAMQYTTSYFREPLAGVFTLTAFWAALSLRDKTTHPLLTIILLVGSLVALALTRFAGIIVVPGILLLLIPLITGRNLRSNNGILIIVGGVICLGVILVVVTSDLMPTRFQLENLVAVLDRTNWEYVQDSLIGYQVSPARSLWLYAPVLVISMGGLIWQRDWSLLVGLMLSVVLISISSAIIHEIVWWAGFAWGPRYLLPLLPVMMLGLFPVVRWLWITPFGRWHVAFIVLSVASFLFQALGISVNIGDYYASLAEASINAIDTALWSLHWSQPVQNIYLLDFSNLDIALFQSPVSGWLLLAIGGIGLLLVSGLVLLWQGLRPTSAMRLSWCAVFLLILPLTTFALLRGVYDDPRYDTADTERITLIDQLNVTVNTDDVVFVQDAINMLAFMNRFKTSALVIGLPLAPGEVHNPDVPARVTSDNLIDLISQPTALVIDYEIRQHDSAWLVMPYGPFVTFAIRPTERYMVEHYFPVESLEVSQRARAIRFVNADAQTEHTLSTGYRFGDLLALTEVQIYEGMRYAPGDIVPVSLEWSVLDNIDRDYSVSVQIGDVETATPVSQRDSLPQGGFGHTSIWTPDTLYNDRHGLALPETTPPGEYCINVIVYYWQDGERLEIMNADDELIGDVVCVARIEVAA